MDAIDRFIGGLDTLLADIAFSGLRNVHPGALEKIEALATVAGELGMEQGAALLRRFALALREYRTASVPGAGVEYLVSLLCGLDFYNKNLMGNS